MVERGFCESDRQKSLFQKYSTITTRIVVHYTKQFIKPGNLIKKLDQSPGIYKESSIYRTGKIK